KALVVDDSSTVRTIISKMLRDRGIESVQAANGEIAYTVLEQNPDVTVAFIDWNMPVMSGIQLVQLIRSNPQYSAFKLVMVTTETEMPRVVTALDAGVDEYIMKPFTEGIFQEKLDMLGIGSMQVHKVM